MQYAVETDNLGKRFGLSRALDGVTLRLPLGQVIGLLGPNGAGKSTLLKILAGLLRPSFGSARILGHPPGLESRSLVAYLPEIDCLYSWMTVKQMADFMAENFPDFQPQAAAELLQFMNLPPDKMVGTLSRGMRARLKLALIMARRAPLLLLDEPLSGIDVVSRGKILEGLLQQYRVGEQTIVFSTHEIREVEGILDQVVFIAHGQVVLEGEAEALRRDQGKTIEEMLKEVIEHGQL